MSAAAEALAGLAKVLPHLITVEMGESAPGEEPWVFAYSIGRRHIWWGGDNPTWVNNGEDRLQGALQRECMARGWNLDMDIRGGHRPKSHCAVLYTPFFHSAHGDTPALALSLALAQAMAGEG